MSLTADEIKAIRDSHYPVGKLLSRMEGRPSFMDAPDETLRLICDLALAYLEKKEIESDLGIRRNS